MASDNLPCADQGGVSGAIRVWSEDRDATRIRTTWTAGDFLPLAPSFAEAASAFAAQLAIQPGDELLDVACGIGQVAQRAASLGARSVGVDLVPYLIAHARETARANGNAATFEVADAEALPFPTHRFDLAVSMFGVIYAARPHRVAAELIRVVRPGGRVVLACWVEDGLVGRVLRTLEAAVPPPVGLPSPLEWGRPETARTRLGSSVAAFRTHRRTLWLRFPLSPPALTEHFAAHHGPTVMTLRGSDPAEASRLRSKLTKLFRRHNHGGDGTTLLAADYLEVRAIVAGPQLSLGDTR